MVRSIVAVSAVLMLVGVGAAFGDAPSPDNPAGRDNDVLGVVPTVAAAHSNAGGGGGGGNLVYHGGKVLLTNRTVPIYWVPSAPVSGVSYSIQSGYDSLINQYFGDVAAASNQTTNVYAVETQYTNGGGAHIANQSTAGAAVTDTAPYPTTGNCSDTVAATTICLTDAQIRAEIQRLSTAGALGTPDANTTYFVFTAKNVGSCYNSSSCAFSSYCAYHSNVSLGGVTVQYANQPYADTVTSACDVGLHPNSSDADATINVTSHEHRESINDPLGNAWYDRRGYEGSDKCAWNFGTMVRYMAGPCWPDGENPSDRACMDRRVDAV